MGTKISQMKLHRELSKDIVDESQVVYILSQIRKIIDDEETEIKYDILYLYSDWVLHSKLDRPKKRSYFINKFDSQLVNEDTSTKIARTILINQRHFFVLNELKIQLGNFFRDNNISSKIFVRPGWSKFIELLLAILMECPVDIGGNKIKSLSIVKDGSGKYVYRFHLINIIDDNNIIKIKLK